MILQQFYLKCLAHASYIVADATTGAAAVVDPQRDVQQYLDFARDHGLRIEHVVLTHLHADFIAGHLELRDKAGARIAVGAAATVEYAHTGVRINAIAPGSMGTPAFGQWLDSMPVGLAGYEAQIPQNRLGRPEEIADAAAWLASDESSYVNGAVIPVDGGCWAKLASPKFD